MEAGMVRLVWQRAFRCCEYCQCRRTSMLPRSRLTTSFPRSIRGEPPRETSLSACFFCNSYKGSDIAGRDIRTRSLVPLFNPRRHKWERHFRWDGALLIGRTRIGRVTIVLLNTNDPFRTELRERPDRGRPHAALVGS